jgi:hypothetical protein
MWIGLNILILGGYQCFEGTFYLHGHLVKEYSAQSSMPFSRHH